MSKLMSLVLTRENLFSNVLEGSPKNCPPLNLDGGRLELALTEVGDGGDI